MKKLCAGLLRTIFCLLPVVALPLQAQVQTTLHNFTGAPDGFNPGSAVLSNGKLFGSTASGGLNNSGLVFSLSTNGTDFTPIHDFTGTYDGSQPNDVIQDGGTLYGTTLNGGANGNGIIYKVSTNLNDFTVLYNFTNLPDGKYPLAGLALANGVLYGTTTGGGTNNAGTIFAISTNGGNYRTVRSLNRDLDGSVPRGALVINNATIYGTASGGGSNSLGTVFKLNTNGSGFTPLWQLSTNGTDGNYPYAGLVLNGSTLYGTTFLGGTNFGGTIFKVNTNGTGYSVLRHLSGIGAPATNNDGTYPKSALAVDNNQIYGFAAYGGTANGGTLFRLSTNGGNFSVLKNFTDNPDGANAQGVVAINGITVYGFTFGGGPVGGGIAFSLLLAPVITAQPESVQLTNGNPASFSVSAISESPLSYQWYFNTSTLLGGKTNSTLNIANVSGGDAGSYQVVVADKFGSVTSSPAVLTVAAGSQLSITGQPQSQTVTNGTPATLTVFASGPGVLKYQWYFNTNTILAGQTNSALNFAIVSNSHAGTYTVKITNSSTAVTSSPALLTVVSKPTITGQPKGLTLPPGSAATFTVTNTGSGVFSYQWYFNTNTLLVGQTNNPLTFASVSNSLAGTYTVVVANFIGSATSSPAVLAIISKPIIIDQPPDQTVVYGVPGSIAVNVSGASPLRFQWYSNSIAALNFSASHRLTGKTNAVFPFTPNWTNASYLYVIITNTLGKATSSVALLTIVAKPLITTNPEPVNGTLGNPASFSVGVIGAPTLKYQWYFNTNMILTNLLGSALAGRTNVSLDFSSVSNSLLGRYTAIITNTFGKATSSPALLAINSEPPPLITLDPLSRTITNGDLVSFSSAATSSGPLSYQWLFNTNSPIANATNTTLIIANANLPGVYAMKATDRFGSSTSSFALLTVVSRPIMLTSEFDQASGSYAFSFVDIAGSTNRLWATTNLADANGWRALATNKMTTNGIWFYTDPNTAKTNAVRFYRFSTP